MKEFKHNKKIEEAEKQMALVSDDSFEQEEGNYFDEFSKQDNLVKKNEENIKYVLDYLNIPVNNDSRKFYALMFDMDYNKQHDLPFDNNYMKWLKNTDVYDDIKYIHTLLDDQWTASNGFSIAFLKGIPHPEIMPKWFNGKCSPSLQFVSVIMCLMFLKQAEYDNNFSPMWVSGFDGEAYLHFIDYIVNFYNEQEIYESGENILSELFPDIEMDVSGLLTLSRGADSLYQEVLELYDDSENYGKHFRTWFNEVYVSLYNILMNCTKYMSPQTVIQRMEELMDY